MKWVGPLNAGDVLIMPEATTHTALPWQPTDRARRVRMYLLWLLPWLAG